MYKLLLCCALAFFAACKGKNESPQKLTNNSSQNAAAFSSDEMDFVDGCVENARESIGEERAFVLCKCILLQVKKENPDMDSATMARMVNDTAKIARLAGNCK